MITGEWTDPSEASQAPGLRGKVDRAAPEPPRPGRSSCTSWLLARHIGPYLGPCPFGKITPEMVREWRASLLADGVSLSATAKAYRLLRAVLMTATEDRIIPPTRAASGARETRSPPSARAHGGPGLRAGRPDQGSPVPGAGPACHLRQPPLGRGHRAAPLRHRLAADGQHPTPVHRD